MHGHVHTRFQQTEKVPASEPKVLACILLVMYDVPRKLGWGERTMP